MSTVRSVHVPTLVPYRVRASLDGTTLAGTDAALRVDTPDAPPILWIPRAHVDAGLLQTLDPGAWRSGKGEFADHVAFDHEVVLLEVVDARDGDDERDATIKRFPTWGDVTELVALLDVHATRDDGPLRAVVPARTEWGRAVVEGSQMLGQAIVAATRNSDGRRPVFAAMVFTHAVDGRTDYAIELDEIQAGRTFTTFGARVVQGARTCSTGTILLDVTAPDVMRHGETAPDVGSPYDATPFDMSVTGRDLRVVDDAYTGDPDAPVGPPELDVWVRSRDVPDDPALHAGLLAQFCGHLSIAAALRAHAGIGQSQAHVTLSTAVNAIALSIHADVRADEWLLYHHRSTFAGDGMTHSECRVYTEAGALVASFTVDSMVRAFADPSKRADARTAL